MIPRCSAAEQFRQEKMQNGSIGGGGCRKDFTLLITQPCDPIGGGRQDEMVEHVIVMQLGAGRHLFIGLVTVEL